MTAKGVALLVFYDGRMNGRNHIDVMKHELIPYIKKKTSMKVIHGTNYVQDNAPYHKSKFSMNCFKENKINVLDWPAVSLGFNAIENL